MRLYNTIVIDPPWDTTRSPKPAGYIVEDDKQVRRTKSNHSEPLDYPTLSVEKLKNLYIPANKNAHLYLWTINKYVEDAYLLCRYWGFKPSTLLVWVKTPLGGLGGTYKNATEYILFCRRGSLKAKKNN